METIIKKASNQINQTRESGSFVYLFTYLLPKKKTRATNNMEIFTLFANVLLFLEVPFEKTHLSYR